MAKANAFEDVDTGSQGVSGALEVMLGTQSPDPGQTASPEPSIPGISSTTTTFQQYVDQRQIHLTNPSPDPGIVSDASHAVMEARSETMEAGSQTLEVGFGRHKPNHSNG